MASENLEDGLGQTPEKDRPISPSSSTHEEEEHEDRQQHEGFENVEKVSSQRDHDIVPPSLHRTLSAHSKPISLRIVPRAERHGLLGRLCLLNEAEDPKGYPRRIKWFITFNIALAAVAAPMGSSIIYREHAYISEEA